MTFHCPQNKEQRPQHAKPVLLPITSAYFSYFISHHLTLTLWLHSDSTFCSFLNTLFSTLELLYLLFTLPKCSFLLPTYLPQILFLFSASSSPPPGSLLWFPRLEPELATVFWASNQSLDTLACAFLQVTLGCVCLPHWTWAQGLGQRGHQPVPGISQHRAGLRRRNTVVMHKMNEWTAVRQQHWQLVLAKRFLCASSLRRALPG